MTKVYIVTKQDFDTGLIEKLEALKAKHGDLIVIAQDEEVKYEIEEAIQSKYIIYDGRKEGPYDIQLAIRLC